MEKRCCCLQGRSPRLKIEKHAHGMCQHFTDQTTVERPEIMDANAGYGKAFGQVRTDRFDPLAQPSIDLEQGRTVRRRHSFVGVVAPILTAFDISIGKGDYSSEWAGKLYLSEQEQSGMDKCWYAVLTRVGVELDFLQVHAL